MKNQYGHVYAIHNQAAGLVKIGHSKRPDKRTAKIVRGFGGKDCRIFISIRIANARQVESECHRALSDSAVGGEWFSVDFDIAVEHIKKRATERITDDEIRLIEQQESARGGTVADAMMVVFDKHFENSKSQPIPAGDPRLDDIARALHLGLITAQEAKTRTQILLDSDLS